MGTDDDTWSIQETARRTGTTSRALRHYHAIGLLEPTDIGPGGYRRYGAVALVRLQRILLLRDLGVGLPEIAGILDGETDASRALRVHAHVLEEERQRLTRRIEAVARTIASIDDGRNPMTQDMFDGFDHGAHQEEVTTRWGADAFRTSSDWWNGMTDPERAEWSARSRALADDWVAAAHRGVDPSGPEAQALAARHVDWLSGIPGTPGAGGEPDRDYVLGLAEMYVADERFAATYGGVDSATVVRDALVVFARRGL
jgi:DNA-binding transcriptional MerR regulator